MFCFSRPADPAGQSPTPAAAAPGAGPAAAAPASEPAPAGPEETTPPACGPGAVAHCPCADAEVTSETVMTEPADRARTQIGVGERVRVTYSLGAAAWTLAGDGSLSSENGATVTYTAPNAAAEVTLTATGSGCSVSISFTIVEPSAVRMFRHLNDPTRVRHTQNFPDIGFRANIFLAPANVNFHRVQFLELECPCTATGVYACHNGAGHGPNANGLGATTHVQGSMGTHMAAVDNIYSGHCGAAWAAPQTGSEHFAIPWRWRVGASGAFRRLATVHQRINADAGGRLTASKAGASVSCLATDPNSNP